MTETDYEKLRRELREMEGRNIAHYSVLLTALIRTKVENARMTAILSAAGIVSLVLILMTLGVQGAGRILIVCVGFAGFFIALWISLRNLENSVENLAASLKDGAVRDLSAEDQSFGAKKFFALGCVCLIALGLLSVWSPGSWKTCCPIKKMMTSSRFALGAGSAAEPEEVKTSARSDSDTLSASFVSQDTDTKTTTLNTPLGSATGTVSQEVPKKSGNAGIFSRGVSR